VPELPEVEVVRRGLEGHVVGRTIAVVEVCHPRAVRRHVAGEADFVARLVGAELPTVHRRGKYLWLPLVVPGPRAGDAQEADEALVGHLGMSGQLLVCEPGVADHTHLRVRIGFTDGGPELRFVDQRTFGGLFVEPLVPGDPPVPRSLTHIARDVLDPLFDDAAFHAALRVRRTGLKSALLDQSLISGVGNIYADEALWRAKLHYARPTGTLRRPDTDRLLAAVREVMTAALALGGTSFDSLYVNVNGQSGYFDRSLRAYGRAGQPCERCGTTIRREPFANRSSYFCPRCQRSASARYVTATRPGEIH
jgi:formamidopyrimidine-DNA glycosylase